jgi:hypothetical protein
MIASPLNKAMKKQKNTELEEENDKRFGYFSNEQL